MHNWFKKYVMSIMLIFKSHKAFIIKPLNIKIFMFLFKLLGQAYYKIETFLIVK